MKASYLGLTLLCMLPGRAADAGATAAFDRYEVILNRNPFGRVAQHAEPALTKQSVKPPKPAKQWRLSMMWEDNDGNVQVGIVDKRSGRGYTLGLGQRGEGIELVSADYQREQAEIRMDGELFLVEMETPSGFLAQPLAAGAERAVSMRAPAAASTAWIEASSRDPQPSDPEALREATENAIRFLEFAREWRAAAEHHGDSNASAGGPSGRQPSHSVGGVRSSISRVLADPSQLAVSGAGLVAAGARAKALQAAIAPAGLSEEVDVSDAQAGGEQGQDEPHSVERDVAQAPADSSAAEPRDQAVPPSGEISLPMPSSTEEAAEMPVQRAPRTDSRQLLGSLLFGDRQSAIGQGLDPSAL